MIRRIVSRIALRSAIDPMTESKWKWMLETERKRERERERERKSERLPCMLSVALDELTISR